MCQLPACLPTNQPTNRQTSDKMKRCCWNCLSIIDKFRYLISKLLAHVLPFLHPDMSRYSTDSVLFYYYGMLLRFLHHSSLSSSRIKQGLRWNWSLVHLQVSFTACPFRQVVSFLLCGIGICGWLCFAEGSRLLLVKCIMAPCPLQSQAPPLSQRAEWVFSLIQS